MRHFRITVEGKTYEVSVEEFDETIPAATPRVASAPASPPSPRPVAPPAKPVAAAAPLAAADAGDDGDIPSPLAGTIISIDVTIGQHVTQGQQLLVLEAMKMNTYITAPRDGQVVAVKVTPGTAVAEGQALLAIG